LDERRATYVREACRFEGNPDGEGSCHISARSEAMKSPAAEADWRRRHALNDALVILDLLREIVVTFLHVDTPEPAKAPVVTLLRSRPDLSA
jgi:hypothetical protein